MLNYKALYESLEQHVGEVAVVKIYSNPAAEFTGVISEVRPANCIDQDGNLCFGEYMLFLNTPNGVKNIKLSDIAMVKYPDEVGEVGEIDYNALYDELVAHIGQMVKITTKCDIQIVGTIYNVVPADSIEDSYVYLQTMFGKKKIKFRNIASVQYLQDEVTDDCDCY